MSVPEPPDYIANDELAVVACRNAYPSLVARGVWDDIFIATLGVLASIAARHCRGQIGLRLRGKKRLKARHFG
jgi:hypothetical protein